MISFVSGGIRSGKQLTSADLASRFNGSAFSESESKRIAQAIGAYPKDFYPEATMLLKDSGLSAEQRARIASLLGSASTAEGVKILGQAWKETKDSAFHSAVVEAFRSGSLAEIRPWTPPNHLNLSKELESLWLTIEDQSFSQAIAVWIAKIGDPSGIQLLLGEIPNGKTIDEILESGNTRAVAAVAAMKEVRNPQAIPILKKTFTSQPSTSATFFACGDALAYTGNADTIQALINWVLQAPDDTADIAGEWFRVAGRADDGLIEKSLTSAAVFRSQKVKTAVLEAIS